MSERVKARRRAGAAVVAGLATLTWLGCRGGGEDAGTLRWIADPPSDELHSDQLLDVDCRYRQELGDERALAGRIDADTALLEGVGGTGVTLRGGLRAPRIRIDREFAPGELSAARVVVSGVRRGEIRVIWSAPGSTEPLGSVAVKPVFGGGALRDHFFLDLDGRLPADAPVTVAVEPTSAAGEVVTVREICLGRAAIDPQRWRSLAQLPWKATLADDTRDVVLPGPDGVAVRELELPRAARLRTAFGQIGGEDQVVNVRVEAAPRGGEARTVYEESFEPGRLRQGWQEIEVDLSGVAPGPAELRLVAEGEPGAQRPLVGVWSAPRVDSAGARPVRPNLVLISLDTVRADHLSLYGYGRPTSPQLEAWVGATGATVFENVVAPSGWTLPSHFSLFTGLDAPRHLANYNSITVDAAGYTFLAELLNRAGYRTQAFTGGGFVHPLYGMAKGFESFAFWASKQTREVELESNLERAQRWLDGAGEEPFLLFLHTYEAHTPNPARQPFFDRLSDLPSDWIVDIAPDPPGAEGGFLGTGHAVRRRAPEDPPEAIPAELAALTVDAYDSALAFLDDRLAPLLRRLSEPPFADNTIVAIFSDHGEALGEGGRVGHAHLALNNLKVPLVLLAPGQRRGLRVAEQVRLIDLFPTLLEQAGLEVPPDLDARTLNPWLDGSARPAGRPAVAYSASTNHGLALLAPGGLKLEWRNSLWRPIAGERHWFRVDGFQETPIEEPATEEARSLLRTAERTYVQGSVGLVLQLVNRSAAAVEVALESDLVDPASVKNRRLEGRGLSWSHIGHLAAPLAAGETLDLQVERVLRREVGLRISYGSPGCAETASRSLEVAVDQLRQTRLEILPLPSCGAADGAAPRPGQLELRLQWRGPLPPAKGAKGDPELEAQLRALGYLN